MDGLRTHMNVMNKPIDEAEIGKVLAPVSAEETRDRERRVRAQFWRTVKRAAGSIPFMDEVVAAYYCALDTETPTRARGILLGSLAYFVLPADFIPDFLLAFGFTDDLAVLTAAITAIRPHIKEHHREAARQALED